MKIFSKVAQALPYLDNCYLAEAPVDQSHIEVVSAFALYEFYRVGQLDYLQFRSIARTYLSLWSSMNTEEQMFLASHNIAPTISDITAFYTEDQRMLHFQEVVRKEVLARTSRWKEAMSKAAFRLLNNELGRLMMYNDAKVFKDDYIDADLPHLILWVQDGQYPALGIDFSTTGFGSKPYFNQTIREEVLSVLTR